MPLSPAPVMLEKSVSMICRTIIAMLGLLAMPALLLAQNETITIKSHSRGGSNQPSQWAFLSGELDGQHVVLQCLLSHDDCKELARGQYEIERLLEDEGSYPNCPNVDLFRLGADRWKEEPLGEYCMRNGRNGR